MTAMPGGQLQGRSAELGTIAASLAAARAGDGGALLIEGPAGSGRTAVLDAACASLPEDTLLLRASGSPDEQVMAYAVLADLCAPLHRHLDELPDLQQRALRGAIALGPPAGDRLAVAAGFLSLLRTAAEAEPLVVIAVDDAHHLDDGSTTAISYAARRLDGCPIAMLIAQDAEAVSRLKLTDLRRTSLGPIDFEDALALVEQVAPATPTALADALIASSQALPGRLVRLVRAADPDETRRAATREPDLEEASDRAVARNSPADEAAIQERTAHAAQGADRVRALVRAGEAWLAAGRPDRARACGEAASQCASGALLASGRLLLARAIVATGSGREARRALAEVVDVAEELGEAEIAVRALLIALPLHLHLGRAADARAALDRIQRQLPQVADDSSEVHLLAEAAAVGVALATGDPVDSAEVVRLLDASLRAPRRSEVPVLVTTMIMPLVWTDRLSAARHLLEDLIRRTRERGALGLLALPLAVLATVERRSGRATRALAAAVEAEQLAEETGDRVALLFARTELANVLAQRGDADRARAVVRSLLDDERPVQGSLEASARSALATVELVEGRWQAVVDLLAPLAASDAGNLSPVVTLYQQNLAVAYARLGQRSRAEAAIAALERAADRGLGDRLPAVVERCRGVLAPRGEYDGHFERATKLAGGNSLGSAITRLLHALRMLDDGRSAEAVTVLSALATSTDENALGVARTARRTLAELGVALAGSRLAEVERLSDEELRVVLASADGRSIGDIADELRTSPGEVVRLRASAYRALGVHTAADARPALEPTSAPAGTCSSAGSAHIRLLGGLTVDRDGQPLPLPAGSVATAIALVSLRRNIHVEQLIEALWPGIAPEVGRRRVRNVLTRVRAAAGPIVHRHGEQLLLDEATWVDVHEVDAALAVAIDPQRDDEQRDEARARALRLYRGMLLPELPFAEWANPDRARLAMARADLLRGLLERLAANGAPDEALAVAEQALVDAPDDEDLIVRAAELALEAGRPSRARGLVRRARERLDSLGVPAPARFDELARRVERASSVRP